MSIIMWEAAMSYASTFKQKNETSLGPKRRIITNWEPYFVMYFQVTYSFTTSLISASQQKCAFYVNELSIGPNMCYIQHNSYWPPLWPNGTFLFHATQVGKFPDFWIEFYAGFYEWVNDRLMTNNYKQYFASSGVYFELLFQTYFKSSRSI